MSDAPIEISGLTKGFRGLPKPALDAVSARILPGRVTGLVGPDGAGKTTLIRLLAGLLEPDAGSVRLAGLDPVREAARLRGAIGYMPQKFGLYEDLSVRENLELHADLRGVIGAERETAFARLLEFTDLAAFTGRLAGRLSGGMKQKLGLACALLGRPQWLLLDEPGVGVDPISRRELWRMIGELVKQQLTVVWSTAYLEEAEQCEDVLVLAEGRLLYAGKPAGLIEPMRGRCFRVLGFATSRRETLAAALRRPEVLDGVIQGRSLRLVLRTGASPGALRELEPLRHADLSPALPRFEDAFIDAMGGRSATTPLLAQPIPDATQAGVVVEAVDLTRRFGAFTAADRITFTVRRGEVFGLLGPNGAGKSTTFRMLCGLLTPTSGTAHVLGINLRRSPSAARQRLGYMAQKFSLYGNLSVRQNLEFFAGAYGLRGTRQRDRTRELLRALNLETALDTPTATLPPGFKQRLSLACALLHEPDVLFLDEPTSGVDPVTRREFWAHINGLVHNGVTVIVTTHFMEEAEYCDRIALVNRGRIIASGTPDDLKAGVATETDPDPSMEDAFIRLVQGEEREEAA